MSNLIQDMWNKLIEAPYIYVYYDCDYDQLFLQDRRHSELDEAICKWVYVGKL